MSDTMLIWVEIIFDVLYLAAIWIITAYMYKKRSNLLEGTKKIGNLFIWSFFLLALGDTGHVGFRVLAYAMGGLEANSMIVGIGKLATALTVTIFYMLVTEIWRLRFNKKRGIIWWGLILTGVARLLIMIPAANGWTIVSTPFAWSLARNIPLMIQGIGVAVIILIDSFKAKDKLFLNISIMIFISYICYIPVILFVQKIPMLGMLMMPKTLAYVAIAFFALSLFKNKIKEKL